jgi:hypothetical protein
MALMWMPFRFEPPASRSPGLVQTGLEQSQECQRHQLDLKGAQERFLGPGPAFLHLKPLFMVPEGILLPKPCRKHLHYLGGRQVQSSGHQEPRPLVPIHHYHEDMHGDCRTTHGPTTPELFVLEAPEAAIAPRPAGQQIPHLNSVVRPDRLGPIGAAGARFMKRAGAPHQLAGAGQIGIIDGDGVMLAPPGWLLLLEQPECLSFHGFAIPGAIFRDMLQDPPAGLQAEGAQNLGNGVFLPAQHHACDLLHEAHPAGPSEHRDKGAQQRQPLRPHLGCWVHDAPPLLASLFGRSQPNRMPWGVSWRVKILETLPNRMPRGVSWPTKILETTE